MTLCRISLLTYRGRETAYRVASDNGLSPVRRQAIIWTSTAISSIRPQWIYFSEICLKVNSFHSRKCTWKCRLLNSSHFVSPQCVDWSLRKVIVFETVFNLIQFIFIFNYAILTVIYLNGIEYLRFEYWSDDYYQVINFQYSLLLWNWSML